MVKTLYVSDLDGTLLNRDAKLSNNTLAQLQAFQEKGILFTYATARSLTSASKAVHGFRPKMPVITYNGAILYNENQTIVYVKYFEENEKEAIFTYFKQYNITPLVYAIIHNQERVSWDVHQENKGILSYIKSRGKDKRFRPLDNLASVQKEAIYYFTCIDTYETLYPAYMHFKKKGYHCLLQKEIYTEDEYWLEILPKEVSKAHAVEYLKEHYAIDRVVAFGDSLNDIPLCEVADVFCAMENAVDELKKISHHVIEDNEHDGVVKWIQKDINR